jgi:hypothetical protein
MISPTVHVLTFTGSGALQALTANTNNRATRCYVEPLQGNSHVAYVGDSGLAIGTSTDAHVIKQIAKPPTLGGALDFFDWDVKRGDDLIDMNQLKFDGTSGEGVRVTVFVG